MTKEYSKTSDPAVGSTRLLGCPFCGASATLRRLYRKWAASCDDPLCGVNPQAFAESKDGLIAKWNQRHPNK